MSEAFTRGVLGAPLHLFTGKGGVGKTTVAAALAIEAARRGGRPVIVELGHRSSLANVLGVASDRISHAPSEVLASVFASNVAIDAALVDYLARRVRSRAIAKRIGQSAPLATFFEAAPAVPELLTLEHVEALLSRFDPVLVDLDATGHALMFLELPRLLAEIAPRGPIGELVRGLGALLTDPARTRVHLVTLPLALPIEETLELHAALRARETPLGALFVNRRGDRPIAPEDDAYARALLARTEDAADREALALALTDASRWDLEGAALARLESTGLPRVVLGDQALDARDRLPIHALAALGAVCAGGLA